MINFEGLTGEIVTREEISYDESRKAWNRAIDKYPLAIVYCETREDISNAIIWAKKCKVPFRVRSGGHNYEGFSTGDDVLVIDISRINKIFIDENSQIVKLDGGVRNREIYEALGGMGYPFPGGGCPSVGVAGLVLGGGWGYSSRLLGLSCDSLLELEIINYNGEIIVANEKENKDLFWACMGAGGGNFGVIISMKFKLPSKIEKATLINIDYSNCGVESGIGILEKWQELFKNLDRRGNGKISLYNSKLNGKGVKLTLMFYGDKGEANDIIKPLLNLDVKSTVNIEYCSVLEVNRKIQDSHPDFEVYKSTGRFVYKDYNKEEFRNLFDLIENRADGSIYTAISFYGLGGAVLDRGISDSAIYYRDAKCILGFQSLWEEKEYENSNKSWFMEKFKYIKSITKGSFINFPLLELDNYEDEYWGAYVSEIRDIKRKYDPNNIFKFQQSITIGRN